MSKQIRFMRKITVFLVIYMAGTWAFAQEFASISDFNNIEQKQENVQPLKKVLHDIEKKFDISFGYDSKSIESKTVDLKNVTIQADVEETLKSLLQPLGMDYEKIESNYYIITKKKNELKKIKIKINNKPEFHSRKSSASEMEMLSKYGSKFSFIAQSKTITGKVTSMEDNEPLPGVNIIEKGTSNGTVTDLNGQYSINVSEGATLVFSSVGYTTEEVEVGDRSVVNLSMAQDIQQLQELVVVGYGAVKKSDLTGSVSSVKSEELSAYPAVGTVQALQGRAAGVQITANNGEPGSDYKVRVRGGTSINASSDPIYVVDGFVGGALPPPEDIESIEVLKDASATAIYGSRGANGVIMVTTKRGKEGQTNIDLNVSYSMQNEINRLDLLNAAQFADYIQDTNPDFTPMDFNTDWQDQIFQTGNIQNYQLGISGGSESVKYYLSGTYYDQKGVVLNSGFQRYSVISNIDIDASDKFRFGLNLFARRTSQDGVRTQEGSGGANGSGVIASAFKFGPDQPIKDANGNYTLARLNDAHDNAVAIARERINENAIDRFQGNLYGEYDILKDLQFRTTLGISVNNGRTGQYTPTVLQGGAGVGGDGRVDASKNSLLLNENYFTWTKEFGNHNIFLLGGYSYQHSRDEDWDARGQGFPTDAGLYWNLGASSSWQRPGSDLDEWELSSFYSRINYNIADKYLFTFNARYDGTSVFSEGNKWAFFPSGAFAWHMDQEEFMSNITAISQWKWRVSYGLTGNRAIAPYQTLAALDNVLTIQGGVPVNALAPEAVANKELTWETTSQFNIGLDVGLLEDRINLIMDYYRMNTTDLLFSVPLPEYSGYGNQLKNIGEVANRGFEFSLNSRNLVGEFNWNMGLNFSANRNEILSLPDGNNIHYRSGPGHMVGLGDTQILAEGEPVGVFFGFVYDGVYQEGDDFIEGGSFEQEPGGEKFKDIDGLRDDLGNLTGEPDGKLNNDDRAIIGNPHPDFIWGWNNDLRWKGFDMNIFFQASQGNDIFSYTLMELDLMAGRNNATTAALDRWTPSNTNTNVPKASGGRSRRASSRWIYDGSFVRLKNLALGYTLPQSLLDRLNFQRIRIYLSAQNILTLTDYEGYDPEVNYRTDGRTNSNRNLGLDYASYPNAKSYTLGLNIGF